MSDQSDPLAHLYAETGDGPLGDEAVEIPTRPTSLAELAGFDAAGDDEDLSDHDANELVVMLEGMPVERVTDGLVVELGLGTLRRWQEDDGPELVLNRAGIKVFRLLIGRRFPGIRFAPRHDDEVGS